MGNENKLVSLLFSNKLFLFLIFQWSLFYLSLFFSLGENEHELLTPLLHFLTAGIAGSAGDRTQDLVHAKQSFYQLSYILHSISSVLVLRGSPAPIFSHPVLVFSIEQCRWSLTLLSSHWDSRGVLDTEVYLTHGCSKVDTQAPL